MKNSVWVLLLLLGICLGSVTGCGPEIKPPTEDDKKKIDEDMKNAAKKNKPR